MFHGQARLMKLWKAIVFASRTNSVRHKSKIKFAVTNTRPFEKQPERIF